MDTVGRNKKAIEEYIRKQLQEDIAYDQISLKEYMDPFTGEPGVKNKKNNPFRDCLRKSAAGRLFNEP